MKGIALLIALFVMIPIVSSGCASRPKEASSGEGNDPNAEAVIAESSVPMGSLSNVNLVQFSEVKAGETIVVMETTMGTIRIRLFPDKAPKAVENFIGLVEEGYYNGKTIHYVSRNYMLQGGSLDGKGGGGTSIFNGEGFGVEWHPDLWHFYGAVSMANAGEENSTLSQFMIIQNSELAEKTVSDLQAAELFPEKVIEKYLEVGGSPHLDGKHTVFGQVIEGMDVVDSIVGLQGEETNTPTEDVVILTATLATA